MAPIVETLEMRLVPTTISLNGAGDLLIESFGSSLDMLEIHADGANNQFAVSDPGQILFSTISGTTGSGTHFVFIPFSSVINAKQLIVNTFDGDDVVRLTSDGVGFNLSPVIDAGTGFDVIESNAVVSVATDNVDVVLNAENIRLGADISTAGGKVSLIGNVTVTNDVSITTDAASDGDVLITGLVDSGAGQSMYTLISTPRSYGDALGNAPQDVPGGQLVTIRSASEQTDVQAVVGTNDAWIAASDSALEGNWIWDTGPDFGVQFWSGDGSTGNPVNGEFSNWLPGEPDNLDGTAEGDAAFLRGSDSLGRWLDGDVNVLRSYVVESPRLFGLTINAASGLVNFNGSVGIMLPLKSLSVTAGAMQFFGGKVSTAKGQTYNTVIALSGTSLLQAEEVNFNGGAASVTGSTNLTLVPINRAAPINVGAATDAGVASFDITDSDIAALATGFGTIFIGEPMMQGGSASGGPSMSSIGPVTVSSSTFLNPVTIAGGSISVTELNAGTNRVSLIANTGSITDGGNAGADVTANELMLDSFGEVGTSSDALDTAVGALAARASDHGGVFVANTGNLVIGPNGAPGGIFSNNDSISVSSSGTMTVSQSIVSRGGDVQLTAANGISVNGVPIDTSGIDILGGDFAADADSDNDGTGTFSISSIIDFVNWTTTNLGVFADGTTVNITTTTLATAAAQVSGGDTRFSDSSIYSPAQAAGDVVETHFSGSSDAVFFSFSAMRFGVFLHFDGIQYQGTPFDPVTDNLLYTFDHAVSKASGDPSWDIDKPTNSIRQLSGDELADQDGTVRFDEELSSLTFARAADGVSPGNDNTVNVQLGRSLQGGLFTNGGAVLIRAADVQLEGFLNANSGLVSLIPSGTNRTVDLGATGGSGQFILTDAELDSISTEGGIVVGDTSTGDITINDAVTRPTPTNLFLTVANNNDIKFVGSNAHVDAFGGNVSLTTGGSGEILSGDAVADITATHVSVTAGSGNIAANGNPLSLNADGLTSNSTGSSNQFFSESGELLIDPSGLSSGSGGIQLSGGTFTLDGSERINDASRLAILPGATIKLNGFNETIAGLNDSGSVVNGSSIAATLTVNQATGTSTFFGTLGGTRTDENNFALTKVGVGTLILAGTNTNTGLTTVGGGKLVVNGSLASNLSVANGGILAGTGIISGSVQVDLGGTVAPGASPGLLSVDSLSLQSGSTFRVELNGNTAGTQYDQIHVTGTSNGLVMIDANVTLDATLGFSPTPGDVFVLIDNEGSDSISGTFNGLSQGTAFTIAGKDFHIVYNFDSGDGNANDVALIVNEPPAIADQSFSISEDSTNGVSVGRVIANDAASGITFAITDGNTGNAFDINADTGEIQVVNEAAVDFESNSVVNLTVEVTDDTGAISSATVTINVTNVAPSLPTDGDTAVNSVSEGAVNGTPVGIAANSGDVHGGSVTFRLTNSAGGLFTIGPASGVVTVLDASLLNFESANSHSITVEATDGVNATTQDFTISVTNVPPATPTDADTAADSVSEGAINGDPVGIDANSGDVHGGAIAFSLIDDAGGRFAIHPSTGVVRVANASLLNFESATSHLITVQASDGSNSTTADFTIAVTNVAPTSPVDGDNSPNAITEGVAVGDPVGIDANSGDVHGGAVTFSLTDDASGQFAIDPATGVVTVANGARFDFTAPASHTIVVQASDGTSSSTKSFTINQFGTVPDAPLDVDDHANRVPEGALEGSRVGITLFATAPDGGTVYYQLTDDVGGRFAVDPLTGVVTVKEGRLLQFSDATQHTIRAVAKNAIGVASGEVTFVVNVTQVPEDALPLASILPTRVSVVEGDSGPNFIEFLVKLNKPSDETITIDFTTRVGDDPTFQRPEGISDDTPFATDEPGPWDFFRSTGPLTFDPGVTEQTLRVQIRPDNVPEPNELFFVQLQSPVNVKLAPQQSIATARILDDDSAPQLIVSNTQTLEGDVPGQNELVFNVQLIGEFPPGTDSATTDFVTGNIAIDTAEAGVDYTAASGTLTFTDDSRQQQVRIPIIGDFIDESDKTVSLLFTNPVGLALSRSEVVGTILNDDSTASILVSISPTVVKVREDNSGSQQVPFVVTLIGKPADTVTVNYATADGTATAGSDYLPNTGSVTFTSADIASGIIQKLIFVTVKGDTTIEPDETFAITLELPSGSPAGVSINPDLAAGKVVIRNDDQAILTEVGDALALALSDDLTTILGNGPKSNPALLAALRTRALEIIRTQGLTKAIVIILDPVDFVLTDTQGRQSGYTEGTGVVNDIPGTYYSGDGAVELMIVPLPPDGTYNVQLAGLGGDFNASVTILDSNGTSTNILSQSLSDGATSSFSFQVGERATIPVGLGLASRAEAASAIGVVGAFGQFGLRLALAIGQDNAERNGLNLDDANARNSEWMSWLSTTVRVARRELLEPLWQTLESPLGDLWATGLPLPDGIPAEFVDRFWSQVGQSLTGVPSGIYRLGDMLESLLPKSAPGRNRSTTPRAGEQGQPNRTPATPGVKAKRSSLESPRSTPANGPTSRGSGQQSSPPNKSNTIKDKSAQSETLPPGQQQSSTPRTHWLWFAFKDESSSAKPAPRT